MANAKEESEPQEGPGVEPLMGRTSTPDSLQQVQLKFPSKESAVALAERRGRRYGVQRLNLRRPCRWVPAESIRKPAAREGSNGTHHGQ